MEVHWKKLIKQRGLIGSSHQEDYPLLRIMKTFESKGEQNRVLKKKDWMETLGYEKKRNAKLLLLRDERRKKRIKERRHRRWFTTLRWENKS